MFQRPPGLGRLLSLLTIAALAGLVLRGFFPVRGGTTLLAALAATAVAGGLAAALARRKDPAIHVLLAALGVLLYVFLTHPYRIAGDGTSYYVFLRSLWEDGDLDLANDYALVSPGEPVPPPTPGGRIGNVHPVGPAIAWAPFYLAAEALSRLTGAPADGLGPLYRHGVCMGTLLYGWLGMVLVYLAARTFTDRGPALLASLGIGLGTFLYYYLVFAPSMAHAPAFAAAALVVWLWVRRPPGGVRDAALLGAACGLAALLRWANGLIVLLPLVTALPRLRDRRAWPRLAAEGAAFAAAAALLFAPQMLVWKALYGSFLLVPQGGRFIGQRPAVVEVLFSPHHGLFSWSPLLYAGLVGLVILGVRQPWRGLAAAAFFAALTRLNAGVADWSGGSAFGARRFDALLPLFGIGLAIAAAEGARLVRARPMVPVGAALGVVVLWNVLIAEQHRAGAWEGSAPVAFEQLGHGAVSVIDRTMGSPFSLPAALWEWARSGRHPSAWESLAMERPYARWAVRMGFDDRMHLEDGWSAPATVEGATCRLLTASAGIVVPLHRPVPYRFGARLMGVGGASLGVRVLVNHRRVGTWEVGPAWGEYEMAVPAGSLNPGRNLIRLRLSTASVAEGAAALAVAGLWLAPAAAAEASRQNGSSSPSEKLLNGDTSVCRPAGAVTTSTASWRPNSIRASTRTRSPPASTSSVTAEVLNAGSSIRSE